MKKTSELLGSLFLLPGDTLRGEEGVQVIVVDCKKYQEKKGASTPLTNELDLAIICYVSFEDSIDSPEKPLLL